MDEKIDRKAAIAAFEAGEIELYTLTGMIQHTPKICHDPQLFFKSLDDSDKSGAWIVDYEAICDFQLVTQFTGLKVVDEDSGLFATGLVCPFNTYTELKEYHSWQEATEGHAKALKALQLRLATSAKRTIEIANKILAIR